MLDITALKALKSGTDIRGVAVDGIDGEPLNLTDAVVDHIVRAFVVFLENRCGKSADQLTVSVGRDSRVSGPRIRTVACHALVECGVTVLDCGLAATPAMFMTTVDLQTDGAIQITASHHPYHRNGLKFFTRNGGLESSDISRILEIAASLEPTKATTLGTCTESDYMKQYAARLRRMICDGVRGAANPARPLDGWKLVVDAGNGAGGFYATDVLAPLGADVSGSQFLEPDGRFPNHIPNPENVTAMASVSAATVAANADLGIIFDTDVDRAACVDAQGREINRNALIALAACIALDGHDGGTIVTDSVTSDGLKWFIESVLGGKHHRFKRGYKNVINEAIRLNTEGIDAPLAIETSGHAAMRDNYFLDDGAYLITQIIIHAVNLRLTGSSLDALIARLPQPAEAVELRFGITEPDFRPYGEEVLTQLETLARENGWRVAEDSFEGVRVSFSEPDGDGWLLLRLSVHDPVMPMNIESNRIGGCRQILQQVASFMFAQSGLNATELRTYLEKE